MSTSPSPANIPDSLDTPYPITPEMVEKYQRDGFVILRGVLSPEEIRCWREVINACVKKDIGDVRPMDQRDTYGKAFVQILHLWERFENLRPLSFSKRLGAIVSALMKCDGVRLMQDQILYKEPGGGCTPWHQDQFYMPFDTDKVCTLWMGLVDISPEMGVMSWARGGHHDGFLYNGFTSDASESFFQKTIAEKKMENCQRGPDAGGRHLRAFRMDSPLRLGKHHRSHA
ncbi:phytanoyl-CoA dioxygenase family protein [Kamptonema cortianum]|nr:phytanoyl-CoA dioxygenase family protein [Kamptonema cortianum]